MRIKEIISQHRRDFQAVYECQHCGYEEERSGYDDAYFHENVIPSISCTSCGKAGEEITSAPAVPAHVVI